MAKRTLQQFDKDFNLGLMCAEANVYTQKDLWLCSGLQPVNQLSDAKRKRILNYARRQAYERGLGVTLDGYAKSLTDEDRNAAIEFFLKLEEQWQDMIMCIACRIAAPCTKKRMSVFITGDSDSGKSYFIEALKNLKPCAPSLNNDPTYRFSELNAFNWFAVYDDGQVEFTTQKDAGHVIQVLGGQEIHVNEKFEIPAPSFATPIIVISNTSNFRCLGYMSAGKQQAALNSRQFAQFKVHAPMPTITEAKLWNVWLVILQAAYSFGETLKETGQYLDSWKPPYNVDATYAILDYLQK